MQAQASSTTSGVETLCSNVSLQCVETLLRAGLGCIAYLRGLLPFENFSEYHLSAEINNMVSTQASGSFSTEGQTRRAVSGVTIMNLKRGFTNEGDKLLDYLEHGIFDAIEKQYLRKFIFAIYLDGNDPNKYAVLLCCSVSEIASSIVEAYTFNFRYHKVPGTNTVVPILSLGDQLSKLSLGYARSEELMAKSLKQGKLPTLGEVKRSLKLMIKTLVTTISHMENLPKSRFGNFKLFFNESTPDDYQPPHFRAGDLDGSKWFFTTHGTSETPEKMCIGNFETGWHGVSMNVTSVSSYLPSVTEDNDALFTGITNSAPKLSPIEEARLRAEDAELQRKDALNRNVVWDADADADGVGKESSDDGVVLARYDCVSAIVPVGLRGDDGAIQPIPEASGPGHISGKPQFTPTRVGKLRDTHDMEDTQVISGAGEVEIASHSHSPSIQQQPSLPPSDPSMSNASTPQVNTQFLEEKLRCRMFCSITSDDMETQETPCQDLPHRLGSMASSGMQRGAAAAKTPVTIAAMEGGFADSDEGILDCDCGAKIEDVSIFCEGGCKRWFHIWCMGYHSSQDKRLPERFLCLDCRLRNSSEWDIITGKIHSDIICRFKDLALFRRAIKVFEVRKPATVKQFREQIGCTAALTSQLLARLEDEGQLYLIMKSRENSSIESVHRNGMCDQ